MGDSSIATGVNFRNAKTITGSTAVEPFINDGVVQSGVTALVNNYNSTLRTVAASFTLNTYRHYLASQATLGAGSSIVNQVGFYASTNMTGATNNIGFLGDIPTAANRWNLYMQGTAPNHIAGNLLLNSLTDTGEKFQLSGSIRVNGQTSGTAGGASGQHLIVNCDGTIYKIALLNA